ncbi:MAG TPA: GntR family transcriptional regulator [Trueperaceae bacterium]|nr:GntR family transcriptional regulator [Trueperaceae bacterium]
MNFPSGPEGVARLLSGALPDVNRDSPLPYYHQLKNIILDQILLLKDDQQLALLPTERELQERYQVSRSVVRQAVDELVKEGYVVRQQGRGTFAVPHRVRHNPQPETARSLGLSGYLKVRGIDSNTTLLSRGLQAAEPSVALALGLAPGAEILRFERVRLAADVPIGLHIVSLPAALIAAAEGGVDDEWLLYGESSMDYLTERLGLTIGHSTRTIEATALDEHQAEFLRGQPGQPALRVRRTVKDRYGRPIEYFDAVYRGDMFEYSLEFDHT